MLELDAALKQNPEYVFAFVFGICLLESLAVVGVIVPGVALLTSACFIAGELELNIGGLLLSGFAGAVIGDQLSFWLGVYLRNKPSLEHAQRPWQKQLQNGLDKGDAFFQRYGIVSLIIGRFIGPIRPFIPVVAGLCHMPTWVFSWVNLLSALAWAPAYLLPAYYAGKAIEFNLEAKQWLYLLLIAASLYIAFTLWRRKP